MVYYGSPWKDEENALLFQGNLLWGLLLTLTPWWFHRGLSQDHMEVTAFLSQSCSPSRIKGGDSEDTQDLFIFMYFFIY